MFCDDKKRKRSAHVQVTELRILVSGDIKMMVSGDIDKMHQMITSNGSVETS